jgi:hypothetical protein
MDESTAKTNTLKTKYTDYQRQSYPKAPEHSHQN